MEIIDELGRRAAASAQARSATSFEVDMDTAIAAHRGRQGGVLYAQAGGGIVHDSTPDGGGRKRSTRRAR
jgi:anthranilate/para-aminobenzoate synthase component I